MKIYDISWPISSDMTAYKDRRVVSCLPTKKFDLDRARETMITLSSHSGTHIDAPSHFIREGNTIDQLDVMSCSGPAQLIDMTHIDKCIDASDIQSIKIEPNMIVLFKTKNSTLAPNEPFNPTFIYITSAAADYLVTCNIRAIGIDYLGIERDQKEHPTHKAFLQANIPIIEGLRLQQVQQGIYFLWCLPLKMQGLDGAPARAILIHKI